uniref:Uncharacterized protein n=1 Tax=viral metagenome TaxID=1070528 RepID=A0A6M3LY20_9ZZZZ
MKVQINMSCPARTKLPTQEVEITEEEWEAFKTGVGVGDRVVMLGSNWYNPDYVDSIKPIKNEES